MTQKLYIPVGIPASGKTTYYLDKLDKSQVLRVSRDGINSILSDDLFTRDIAKTIKKIETFMLETVLNSGYSAYLDRTNLTPKLRKKFISIAKAAVPNVYVVGLIFPIDMKIALERNANRVELKQSVRDGIAGFIETADKQLILPRKLEGFDEIITI